MLKGRSGTRLLYGLDGSPSFVKRGVATASSGKATAAFLGSAPKKEQAQVAPTKTPNISVGNNPRGRYMETSASFNVSPTQMGQGTDIESLLEGLIEYDNEITMRELYKDIYRHDLIAGTAVDIQSYLPYSDFTLSGVDDRSIMETFHNSVESLNLKSLLPNISVDMMVLGKFVGSLNFSEEQRIYNSMVSHDLDNCEFIETPVYGMDPFINVKVPTEWNELFKDSSTRAQSLRKMIPQYLLDAPTGSTVELIPASTLFLYRQGLSTEPLGTSYFRRIVMIHFLEKSLLRGTVEQARRRQRSVGFIQAGTEDWEPSAEDLNSLAQMWMNADADPMNAVLAVRQGIEMSEIKPGGDFWKFDDVYDLATTAKLRALGISEAFLSGDANISTMDQAMSTFIEQMSASRDNNTRKIFYEKLFPMIAVVNGFKKKTTERASTEDYPEYSSRYEAERSRMGVSNRMYKDASGYVAICDGESSYTQRQMYERDLRDYITPRVQWNKRLKPEADKEYIDMLTELSEKGIPIPIRLMAASAGLNLDELLAQQDEDIKLRNKIKEKQEELLDDVGGEFASLRSGVEPIPFKDRNFTGEEMPPAEYDSVTGKFRTVSKKRRKEIDEKMNKQMAETAKNINERETYKENEEHRKSKL